MVGRIMLGISIIVLPSIFSLKLYIVWNWAGTKKLQYIKGSVAPAEIPIPAIRPLFSAMDCAELISAFGLKLTSCEQILALGL